MVKPSTATLNVNDLDAIVKTIEDMLGNDNQIRKQAETLLTNTANKDFNGYVVAFTKLIKDNPKDEVRIFCMAMFNRFFSYFSESEESEEVTKQWVDARPETQKLLKETLLELLEQAGLSSYVKSNAGRLIADLASTIHKTNSENKKKRMAKETIEWNELKETILEFLDSNDEALAENILKIVSDICEMEPNFLAKESSQILNKTKEIIQKDGMQEEVKQLALKTIGILISTYHKKIIQKSETVKEIGEAIFKYIIDVIEDADPEWNNAPEEFDETTGKVIDESHPKILPFLAAIDSIVGNLPKKITLEVFSQLIFEKLQHNDWKHQHCALMSLSQLTEHITDLDKYDPIVNFIVNALQHEHPKVRYAALHCIGQAAEDHRPKFQERYSETLLPLMIKMYADNIPRVAYHSLNATMNFLEQCPKEIVSKFLPKILEPAISFVEKGTYGIKQSAISTIASLADACGSNFLPYCEKAYEVVLKALNDATEDMAALKGISLKALTLIAEAVGRTEFNKVCGPLINKMLEIHPAEVETPDRDMLSRYVIESWGRVFKTLKDDLTPYISTVMPPVFGLAKKLISQERAPEEEDFMASFRTIACFFACGFSKEHAQYIEPTLALFLPSLSMESDKLGMRDASIYLVEIIESIDSSSYSDKLQVLKAIYSAVMSQLWTLFDSSCASESEIKECLLEVAAKVIQKVGKVMPETDLKRFIDALLNESKQSQDREAALEEGDEDNEDDEDDDEDDAITVEQDLQWGIVDIIGALFQAYKEQTLPLVEIINNVILPKALSSEASKHANKIGLMFISNIIEYLGIELVPEKVSYYLDILVKYGMDSDSLVRNNAVYGIGIYAERAKESFTGVSGTCMKVLYDALLITKEEDDDQTDFDRALDNTIAAIGRIIKFQHQNIDVNKAVKVWLGNLPLREDIDEAKTQHDMFVEMLIGPDVGLVLGTNGENLERILEIIAKLLDSKFISDKFERKAVDAIEFLKTHAATKDLMQEAIGKLELKLQDKLKVAITANS